jgi:hypothetical protein
MWCIPPKNSAEFVAQMEDVLEVYHRPYDRRRPVVCMDETSTQLIGEVRGPLPAAPGGPARFDSAYVRNGVASLFTAFEPLAGRRRVEVTDTRKRGDWARFIRGPLDGPYRSADRRHPSMAARRARIGEPLQSRPRGPSRRGTCRLAAAADPPIKKR